MMNAIKFQPSNPKFPASFSLYSPVHRPTSLLRFPINRRAAFSLQSLTDHPPPPASESEPFISSQYVASVGSLPSSFSLHCNFTQRHILILNVIACAAAVSATWLFVSAIPTILAFKRAANSLEKLMDATREELPDTMAAIRLSGMEISDLTMELSDLGQEITQGVRNSTRAVRVAEERLRGLTNMTRSAPASLQRVSIPRTETIEPIAARTARGIKEGIAKGRAILQMFFTLTQFSKVALNYFKKRARK